MQVKNASSPGVLKYCRNRNSKSQITRAKVSVRMQVSAHMEVSGVSVQCSGRMKRSVFSVFALIP